MKKIQVVAIHGGDPGTTREEYIRDLESSEAEADDFKQKTDWKTELQKTLENAYEVFNPRMPLKETALYPEWKIWFEKLVPFLRDGVVLIGHSLGGIFLAKYLSENKLSVRIRAVMLVAAPFQQADKSNEFGGFAFGKDLSLVEKQADEVYLYHSTDDSVVDYGSLKKFEESLPKAKAFTFHDRNHIWQLEFPEIVAHIKSLS